MDYTALDAAVSFMQHKKKIAVALLKTFFSFHVHINAELKEGMTNIQQARIYI